MAYQRMTPAEKFFYKHAGFSYDPQTETKNQGKRRCATEMAEAEAYLQDMQWSASWEWEQFADLSWMTDEEREQEHEVLCCILRDEHGNVLASLGNIVDADLHYMRVVEAELADEVYNEIKREQRESVAVYNYCSL